MYSLIASIVTYGFAAKEAQCKCCLSLPTNLPSELLRQDPIQDFDNSAASTDQ
jgi:hypothetical protein